MLRLSMFFFFSSRRRHTRSDRDWSSDVCSSDLLIELRRAQAGAMEFYQLGLDPVFEISAEHGVGVGDLLEAITERLKKAYPHSEAAVPDGQEVQVAIVGRPNAGKSSLVNRLLREERMIVSELPGTTRDSVDTMLMWHRRQFRIVDTACIRRAGPVAARGQGENLNAPLARPPV